MILFYGHRAKYGFLSNFYPSPFVARSISWPTVEHFFQAIKSRDKEDWKRIAALKNPMEAKRAGRQVRLLGGWDRIRISVMEEGLYRKFSFDQDLKRKLLDTGHEAIHEDSPTDFIWGWRNNGQDLLGKLLIDIRGHLRIDGRSWCRNPNVEITVGESD